MTDLPGAIMRGENIDKMLYPLKFKPVYKERIWGGEFLAATLGRRLPAGRRTGESWELSGLEGDVSVVSEGRLKGNNLQELIEVYMGDLVGDCVYEKFGIEFPLLVKFIDAGENLSVQVHPNDALAAERHNAYGKTELWYVVDARPGAVLYVGFREGVRREDYLRAVEENTLVELLNRVEVKAGDAYFIPAGTVHAIGAGILLAEIQQTSDITYRIYDWGRTDDGGIPRELHTGLAAGAIDFLPRRDLDVTPVPVRNVAVPVKECRYFTVNIIEADGSVARDYSGLDSFVIYMNLDGKIEVECGGDVRTLGRGETVLIPAEADGVHLTGKAKILEVYINCLLWE